MAINTPTTAYVKQKSKRALIRAIYAGTQFMRDQGVTYLPKEPGETAEMYLARKKRTYLYNAVESAVLGIRGKVFSETINVENASGKLDLENVDMQGTHLTSFAAEVFTSGVLDGISYILVDAPSLEGATRLSQQRALNGRPFFTHVQADNVIGAIMQLVNNVPTLVNLRISETDVRIDEITYDEESYERVRQYKLVGDSVQVLVHEKLVGQADAAWSTVTDTMLAIPRIPVVAYYTNRVAQYEAEPFFKNLAWANLQHWQKKSDHDNILHVVNVPRFYAYGFAEGETATIEQHGAASVIVSSANPKEVDAGWIVAEVNTIEQSRKDIEQLEEQMDAQALEPLVTKATADITATRTKTDSAKSNSVIQFWARSLSEALSEALAVADQLAGVTTSNHTVSVNDEYTLVEDTASVAKELREWHASGLLSARTVRDQGKEIGLLPVDLDEDLEKERLAEEMMLSLPSPLNEE